MDNADKQLVKSIKSLLCEIRRPFPESGIEKISYTVYLTDPPVDPYTFGFWLCDGVSDKPYISIFDKDRDEVLAAIPYKHTEFYANAEGRSKSYCFEELKKLLVENHGQKKIPNIYLRASEKQRWELLAGLMDSGGLVSSVKGQSIYSSENKNLAEGMSELLWSLGIKNAMTETASDVNTGEMMYTIRFVSFDDMPVSRLTRHLVRRMARKKATRNAYHFIQSIEPIGNGIPMQCIQVDSPSHCYLAGKSMIPIVYDVAKRMVEMTPALLRRSKIMVATKRIVNYSNAGYYQVVSADVANKHGYSISGLCFDELYSSHWYSKYIVILHFGCQETN